MILKIRKFILLGFLLGTIAWFFVTVGQARAYYQLPTPVLVRPQQETVQAGSQVTLFVQVQNVQELYAFEIILEYDPTLLEVVDSRPREEGVQVELGGFLDSGFTLRNQADNSLGRLQYTMTQLNPSLPKSGTGNLLVINFRALAPSNNTRITVTDVKLAGQGGRKIEAVGVDGVLKIQAGTEPVLPASATPTLAPGESFITPTLPPAPPPPPSITPQPTPTVLSSSPTPIPATATTLPSPTLTLQDLQVEPLTPGERAENVASLAQPSVEPDLLPPLQEVQPTPDNVTMPSNDPAPGVSSDPALMNKTQESVSEYPAPQQPQPLLGGVALVIFIGGTLIGWAIRRRNL